MKTFENNWESAVSFDLDGKSVELVFNKEEQTLILGTYQTDDPEGTLQTTELARMNTSNALSA